MKIFSYVLVGVLFLTHFPLLQAQPVFVNKSLNTLQDKFDTAWKQLKDFKNCFTGKKECAKREKIIKYTVVTAAALVLLSAVIVIVPRIPGIIQKNLTIDSLKAQNQMMFNKYTELVGDVRKYEKTLPEIKVSGPLTQFNQLFDNDEFSQINEVLEEIASRDFIDLKARENELKKVSGRIRDIDNLIELVRDIVRKK